MSKKLPVIYKVMNNNWHEGYFLDGHPNLDHYRRYPRDYQISEYNPAPSLWRDRETARFDVKLYARVPDYFPTKQDQYAHVSVDNPLMIAFTESDEKGQADRQTRMKPGRYLKKFYPHLREERITELATRWAADLTPVEIKFATTPEEIERVYTTGPHSCMAHPAQAFVDFGAPFHPTRVYGAGDLAVAYFEKDGEIKARVLCWPEKKAYVPKFYGDRTRLEQGLRLAGFTSGRMLGARLLKVPVHEGFVCPYVDNEGSVYEDGDFLRIGSKDDCKRHNAQSTQGSTNEARFCCVSGEWHADWSDWRWVYQNNEMTRQLLWSPARIKRDAFHCPHTGNYYNKSLGRELSDGRLISEHAWERWTRQCAGTGGRFAVEDTLAVDDAYYSTRFVREAIERLVADRQPSPVALAA